MDVIYKDVINEGGTYKVLVLQDNDRLWVGIIALSDHLVRFWSTGLDTVHSLSYEALIEELKYRMVRFRKEQLDEDDVLLFWPPGWDCWGGCIPEPLLEYLSSEEL